MKDYLIKISRLKFILLGILAIYSTSLLIHICTIYLENKQGPDTSTESVELILEAILNAGILGPLLETFIFQHCIYLLLKRIIRNEKIFLISFLFTSSLLFSLAHQYSTFYIFMSYACGIILAYFYYISTLRKESAFWMTVSLHACYNISLIVLRILFFS